MLMKEEGLKCALVLYLATHRLKGTAVVCEMLCGCRSYSHWLVHEGFHVLACLAQLGWSSSLGQEDNMG